MKRSLIQFIRIICTAVCVFFVAQTSAFAAERDQIVATIEEADATRKRAAEFGHEWRYTGKWIKNARAALEAGDLEKAAAEAQRAMFEASRAVEQAKKSKTTWEIAVPK